MTKIIDWKKEAELINSYAEYQIGLTKGEVIEYLESILAINPLEELFYSELVLLKKIIENGIIKYDFSIADIDELLDNEYGEVEEP